MTLKRIVVGQARCSFDTERKESMLHFSPQGKNLLAYSEDQKRLNLFKLNRHGWDFDEVDTFDTSTESINSRTVKSVHWSPDGTAFVCIHDKGISVWETGDQNSEFVRLYNSGEKSGEFLSWGVHNKQLVFHLIARDGFMTTYMPAEGSDTENWLGSQSTRSAVSDCEVLKDMVPGTQHKLMHSVTCIATQPLIRSRNKPLCAVALDNGTVIFVKGDGKPLPKKRDITFEAIDDSDEWRTISVLSYSPDGEMLAAGGTGGGVQIWRVGPYGRMVSFQKFDYFDPGACITCLAWSPDCNRLAVGTAGGQAAVWTLDPLEQEVEWIADDSASPVHLLEFFGRDLCMVCKNEPLQFCSTKVTVPFDEFDATWRGRKF